MSNGLTDKERAILEAARREAAARKGAPAAAVATPRSAEFVTTPMDQHTVLGWDHPAAAQAEPHVKIGPDKWSQVASLMEAERQAEAERRARFRKVTLYVLLGVAVAMLALVLVVIKR